MLHERIAHFTACARNDLQHSGGQSGVGHCLRGTYTYRVHSTIMISTPGGDFNDAAYSSEHRWACP